VTPQAVYSEPGRAGTQRPHPRDRSEVDLSTAFRAPRTGLEEQLARLWRDRLAVDPVGIDDDFFELGGHSLMAADMLADIQQLTGAEVSAATLFLEPTIADLAEAISDQHRAGGRASGCGSPE
jgi:acyl carrier protein